MEKERPDYPNNINPNAYSSAKLAIERAKLAMSLNEYDSPEAQELINELLDRADPGEEE